MYWNIHSRSPALRASAVESFSIIPVGNQIAEYERQAAMSAALADSHRSFITVRPDLRSRAPSGEAGLAGAIILVVRDVVAGWRGGVMARRGDGGRRGSDHPAWMGED